MNTTRHNKRRKTRTKPAPGEQPLPESAAAITPLHLRLTLYPTVFITGGVIMMLEILGTRIIGSFYGISLFVWSSLISVTLISLAVGYYLGGLTADKFDSFRLHRIVALAGFFTALILAIKGPVLSLTNPLGIRIGSFLSALGLFSIPLTLLAMIGPRIIKLFTHEVEKVGRVSGSVFAFSTVGSVFGTLLLGFYLLPALGTRFILCGISISLFALALVLWTMERSGSERRTTRRAIARKGIVLPLFILCLAAAAGIPIATGGGQPQTGTERFRVVGESESMYGKIRVIDDAECGIRWLLSDMSAISAVHMSTREPVFPYLALLEILPCFHPEGRTALMIGLGAGYLPAKLNELGIETDVIEIDPAVAHAAKKYFAFEQPGRLIVGDARYEIKKIEKKYDFIIHDCFSGSSVPPHLLSVEMIGEIRSILKDDGILALNFVGFTRGDRAEALASVDRTLAAVFAWQKAYVADSGENLIDNIYLASMEPIAVDTNSRVHGLSRHARTMLHRLDSLERRLEPGRGPVITDDFNPLQKKQARMAESYREMMLSRLGGRLLSR